VLVLGLTQCTALMAAEPTLGRACQGVACARRDVVVGHVGDPLELVPATALLGGTAIYLLAHVAFRLRNVHTLKRRRLALAVLLSAFIPGGRDPGPRDLGRARRRARDPHCVRDAQLRRRCATDCVTRRRDMSDDVGSWFPVPDESELPDSLRGLLAKVRENLGFVPNVLRAWSYRGPSA
jgi:hypothetical protein